MNPTVTYIYLHNRVPALTYRFTVEQFHRLADAGILVWGDGTELIDGQIATQGVPRRFTVEEFRRMGELGILRDDERVELLDGDLILMSPIGYRHATTLNRLNKFFTRRSEDRYEVSPQHPIEVFGNRQPQPDLVLMRPEMDQKVRHPRPADIFLLIEIADSSLTLDRATKLPNYAEAEIAEYWIVNLTEDRFEVHRRPVFDRYDEVQIFGREESVAPLAFPDLLVPVGKMIP